MVIPPDWEVSAERAKQAARRGRWDQVREYYAHRESWLKNPEMTASMAADLAATDREIESMILVARAAAGTVLEEASSARRAVGRLRSALAAGIEPHTTVSRRA